jgi:hypothetical protein
MDFELAGRYFGSAFGSAPVDLLMQVQPGEEASTKPYETMGQITSPRLPSPLKAYDLIAPKRQSGRFSTEPLSKRKAR